MFLQKSKFSLLLFLRYQILSYLKFYRGNVVRRVILYWEFLLQDYHLRIEEIIELAAKYKKYSPSLIQEA